MFILFLTLSKSYNLLFPLFQKIFHYVLQILSLLSFLLYSCKFLVGPFRLQTYYPQRFISILFVSLLLIVDYYQLLFSFKRSYLPLYGGLPFPGDSWIVLFTFWIYEGLSIVFGVSFMTLSLTVLSILSCHQFLYLRPRLMDPNIEFMINTLKPIQ